VNISRSERRIAAVVRAEIKDGLKMVVQEGATDQDQFWVEFYAADPGSLTVRSLSFNLPREDLAALGALLQEFARGSA
jgi:hypothetical protein